MAKKQKEKTKVSKAINGFQNPLIALLAALLMYFVGMDDPTAMVVSSYAVERVWSYLEWRLKRDGAIWKFK